MKRAASGEEILIANHGKPVAMLSRIPERRKKAPWDIFKGRIKSDGALKEYLNSGEK